jgi:CRP/FNR family transcriptional regulator, cyclic AMP receptor protein
MTTSLRPILEKHPFFKDLSSEYLETLTGCAANAVFPAGKYLFHHEEEANQFYLVREGKLAVELHHPSRQIIINTADAGDILGWSWLFPPYRWHFDVRAVVETRALALDGKCLRGKIEADHNLGYELMKRFAQIMVRRLESTQLQLLDIYK